MTIRLCRWERLVHRLAIWACFRMTLPGPVTAQAPSAAHPVLQPVAGKWQIEPQTSLAWWQVNPHFNHLWATSCPRDPFWQPGEGASDGSAIDLYSLPNSHSGGRLSPPEEIPLFRRLVVMPLCGQAVAGEVVLPKASSWEGVTGKVTVEANTVITGSANRDRYMFTIVETVKYPQYSFRLDRLDDVQAGDTLRATAVGVFTLHGVDKPVSVPVKAWAEGDGIRVTGQWMIPASALLTTYNLSKFKLGLGVASSLWKELHMGFDLMLVPPP